MNDNSSLILLALAGGAAFWWYRNKNSVPASGDTGASEPYQAPVSQEKPTINLPKTLAPSGGLQARQRGGVWYALDKGSWRPINSLERIQQTGGKYFAIPWYMRPNA